MKRGWTSIGGKGHGRKIKGRKMEHGETSGRIFLPPIFLPFSRRLFSPREF
jgi:hypothetical protein